nr:adenylate/guanylate cyclase domain-containing protein [Desulfobulbaceae bacterium]
MDTFLSAPASISLIDSNGSVVKTWRLEGKKTYRIGRSSSNEITLNHTWISRQHAMLQVEANGAFNALDMGSSNGTFVNGKRVFSPTQLRSGDLIQIGNKITLTFMQNTPFNQPDQKPEEEEKTVAFMEKEEVTVLICDIRDFTTLSEELGDEKISEILQLWTQSINTIVSQHKGNVDKFIGDAVMAIWAGSRPLQKSVHLALSCALKISEFTKELGNAIPELPQSLAIGAALNTGEAVIGNIGVDGNRDYTVIGDVVNIAFRLEGLTEKIGKELLLGHGASSHLDPQLRSRYFQTCKYIVKGKKDPVSAHGCDFTSLKEYLSKVQ